MSGKPPSGITIGQFLCLLIVGVGVVALGVLLSLTPTTADVPVVLTCGQFGDLTLDQQPEQVACGDPFEIEGSCARRTEGGALFCKVPALFANGASHTGSADDVACTESSDCDALGEPCACIVGTPASPQFVQFCVRGTEAGLAVFPCISK